MSHALTPSSPLLHSHMDFYPPYFFTNTLIPFNLASFTMTPIPLLALYTHFITSILTTIITSPSQFINALPLIMPREIVTVQVGQCGNQSGNL